MTDALTTWLLEQFDINASEAGNWIHCDGCRGGSEYAGTSLGCDIDEARKLIAAEVDAKRRIVNWHDVQRDDRTPWGDPVQICRCGYDLPCSTLRLLALPYADRPGYRDEWRP